MELEELGLASPGAVNHPSIVLTVAIQRKQVAEAEAPVPQHHLAPALLHGF